MSKSISQLVSLSLTPLSSKGELAATAEAKPLAPVYPEETPANQSSRARPRLWSWRWISFLALAVVPTSVAAIYMAFIASDQYIAEFSFNLRSGSSLMLPPSPAGGGLSLSVSGVNPMIVWDSQAVVKYIKSYETVRAVDRALGFKALYANSAIDFFSRSKRQSYIEEMTNYWNNMADPFFDMTTGITSVKIYAFSPKDALAIANVVLSSAEKAVNEMSMRSREDAVRQAEAEVSAARESMAKVELQVKAFRDAHGIIDPGKEAELDVISQNSKRTEIGKLQARYETLGKYLSVKSPSMQMLHEQIQSLEDQTRVDQSRLTNDPAHQEQTPPNVHSGSDLTGDNRQAASGVIADYQSLVLQQQLTERSYAMAEESLQKTKIDQDRQQIYLNAIVRPALPELSLYPHRVRTPVLVFALGCVLWLLMMLGYQSIRDHL